MSWSRGDIELQQAVAGDSALLDGYVALRVSQSAWVLGWAKDAIAGQPQASTTAAFLDTGRILFDSYRVTETSFDASIAASISHVQDLSSAFATGGLVVEVGVGMGGLLLWWRQRRALRQAIVGPVSSILQTLAIAVPMIVGARVVGVIEAGADHPVELSTVDMELIDTLSSQAATAIEAARLYERAEELGRTVARNSCS
ncbi:MAG TPA: GAF domain-containing protein [Candidatus Dormibacteraeota bacterium]|nr:GAF domain-containing protein [Candidatus Dormibacteraeota bacterium]